ncbi:glucose 1-dehydrogenase [Zavarzinia sp.]|uniref:glucose 1-dehydrogenase n=1 Tax=Zavarzinia sp. TaxID=2027920 RepID=UPI003BB54167|nr:glucose 1-dehydrogenase [Zavarzinia sp.]
MSKLQGRIAIVTGGAAGIGFAAATLLSREGATVVLTDIDEAGGIAAAATLPGALFIAHDVASEASWQAVMAAVIDRFGRLDILVNNAGIQLTRALEETSLDDWHRVMNVNADSAFLGTKLAIGIMKTTGGGSIVNLSSTFGIIADGLNAAYCASKAAVRHFTKAAALYCADRGYGIRVNSVHPGLAWTPMLEREIVDVAAQRGLSDTSSVRAEWNRICPLGVGTAEDIAEGILYLASDASKYVTGSELVIDGGHIIR